MRRNILALFLTVLTLLPASAQSQMTVLKPDGRLSPWLSFTDKEWLQEKSSDLLAETLEKTAASRIEAAAMAGDVRAAYLAGFGNARGIGDFEKNAARAYAFYDSACEGGEARACVNAGRALELGEGVEAKRYDALASYRRACELGHSVGCSNFANLSLSEPDDDTDYQRILLMLRKACMNGHEASCQTANQVRTNIEDGACEAGGMACQRNETSAPLVRFYVQEGCSGLSFGTCEALGDMYSTGLTVGLNLNQAAIVYMKGCDSNQNPMACLKAGDALAEGRGVPQNDEYARKYYLAGCDLGSTLACLAGQVHEQLND